MLELGRQYEVASGNYPWNPLCLSVNALHDIDLSWISAYEDYKGWVAYEVEKLKKSGG